MLICWAALICSISFYSPIISTTRSIATTNPTQTTFQSMVEVFSFDFLILVSVADSHRDLTERKQIDNELVFVFCVFDVVQLNHIVFCYESEHY